MGGRGTELGVQSFSNSFVCCCRNGLSQSMWSFCSSLILVPLLFQGRLDGKIRLRRKDENSKVSMIGRNIGLGSERMS